MTEALHKAAQAVLDRWDSPQWEWRQHGPTADLMADLRAALAQPAAPDVQPVAWIDKHGNIDRGLDAILSPDGWIPLYAAAQAAQPAPQPLTEAAPTRADLVAALTFYADGQHFDKADPDAWDTVSGEPQNWWCDEAGTATVEDGSIAEMALAGKLTAAQIEAMGDDGITAAPTTDKGQG